MVPKISSNFVITDNRKGFPARFRGSRPRARPRAELPWGYTGFRIGICSQDSQWLFPIHNNLSIFQKEVRTDVLDSSFLIDESASKDSIWDMAI